MAGRGAALWGPDLGAALASISEGNVTMLSQFAFARPVFALTAQPNPVPRHFP
jgi:hypothetical protein